MQRRRKNHTQQTAAVDGRTASNDAVDDRSCQLNAIDETDDGSELVDIDPDDRRWDAFIADDDERDPQPDFGDFSPLD